MNIIPPAEGRPAYIRRLLTELRPYPAFARGAVELEYSTVRQNGNFINACEIVATIAWQVPENDINKIYNSVLHPTDVPARVSGVQDFIDMPVYIDETQHFRDTAPQQPTFSNYLMVKDGETLAYITVFPDNTTVTRWATPHLPKSTVVWNSLEEAKQIHGQDGIKFIPA